MKTRYQLIQVFAVVGAVLTMVSSQCRPGTPPPVTDQPSNPWGLTWNLHNAHGILHSTDNGDYWAGRVNDFVELDQNGLLVAAEMGGIWWLTRSVGVSLSKEWENPDMQCIAKGASNTSFFAGGYQANNPNLGALYITDNSAMPEVLTRWHPVPLPAGIGSVNDILVVSERNLIVLATSSGIWSSPIPTTPGGAGFSWSQATIGSAQSATGFHQVELGVGGDILASQTYVGGAAGDVGLYFAPLGTEAVLNFQPARVIGVMAGSASVIYMDVYRSDRQTVYADVTNQATCMGALVKSTDGGHTYTNLNALAWNDGNWDGMGARWVPTGNWVCGRNGIPDRAGGIAVHPNDPNVVVVSGANGPYYSVDGGLTFKNYPINTMHQDQPEIKFSQYVTNRHLVASDGGIAYCDDNIRTVAANAQGRFLYHFEFNRMLANLQFLSPTGMRQWWGTLCGNPLTGGLMGGLQDNDNVICASGSVPWRFTTEGNDGGGNILLANNALLTNSVGARNTRYFRLNPTNASIGPDLGIPISSQAPGVNATVNQGGSIFNLVQVPVVTDGGGRRLFAISSNQETFAGTTNVDNNNLYGIFANADGTSPSAAYLGDAGFPQTSVMSALASKSGEKIYVGTRGNATITKMTRGSGIAYTPTLCTGLPACNNFGGCEVVKILPLSGDAVFADITVNNVGDLFWSADGDAFNSIRGNLGNTGRIFSIEADLSRPTPRLFAATDDGVYGCENFTDMNPNWIKVSTGLPRVPHCSDLFVSTVGGQRRLYLSTFGWSVWFCVLN